MIDGGSQSIDLRMSRSNQSHTSNPQWTHSDGSFYAWCWKGFTLSIHYPLTRYTWNNIIFYGITEPPFMGVYSWFVEIHFVVHLYSTLSGGNISRSLLTGILQMNHIPSSPRCPSGASVCLGFFTEPHAQRTGSTSRTDKDWNMYVFRSVYQVTLTLMLSDRPKVMVVWNENSGFLILPLSHINTCTNSVKRDQDDVNCGWVYPKRRNNNLDSNLSLNEPLKWIKLRQEVLSRVASLAGLPPKDKHQMLNF